MENIQGPDNEVEISQTFQTLKDLLKNHKENIKFFIKYLNKKLKLIEKGEYNINELNSISKFITLYKSQINFYETDSDSDSDSETTIDLESDSSSTKVNIKKIFTKQDSDEDSDEDSEESEENTTKSENNMKPENTTKPENNMKPENNIKLEKKKEGFNSEEIYKKFINNMSLSTMSGKIDNINKNLNIFINNSFVY
jgi:hypothetical protein